MPAAYQIKDQTTPHYLTFQVVWCVGLFLKTRRHQQLQRIKQQHTEASNTTGKLWAGACEYITENGQQKTLTYLSGPEGVFALHVKNPNGTENIRYIHKDHLGTWHTITDENGNLLQELSFDAWGNRRNPATWRAFTGTPPEPIFDRGFTGHEHLYSFGLINMNGRIYDPLVSRMLSPDNFIQAPGFSQSFNRYSYVWNNPLIYTDPSGEIALPVFFGIFAGMYQGAMIASNSQMSFGGAMATIVAGGIIGGLTGLAGGYAGQFVSGWLGVATTTGGSIATGAAVGASTGFTTGFIGGTGYAWIGGAGFGEGLQAGLVAGGYGALGGAVIGGVHGGSRFSRLKRYFTRLDDGTIATTVDGKLIPSDETLDEFSEKFFKDYKFRDRLRDIHDNEKVVSKHGKKVNAFTSNILIEGRYNIYYANSAFDSKMKLFMTMGHEYVHVAHFINISSINENYSEYAALKWESLVTSYNKDYSQERLSSARVYLRNAGIFTITPQIHIKLKPYEQFRSWGLPMSVPYF